ncbi:MAG: urea ABC transporter substrate-binding protein, partial [Mariprofundaceae bacterium]|nr:urea ABC transporter substrate-binding protein [Mariprofundaceae bacterium]
LIVAVVLLLFGAWFFLQEEPLPPIKVGILHSLSGTMAISEKPVMEATLLAIEEINAEGGLLGRKVEPIILDGKSDASVFAQQAEHLLADEKVSAVFGCWTSACRKTVKPIFEKYNNLLFYPVQYEGLEQSPNIVYTGGVPNQQIFPAVFWSLKKFGPRMYLLGSDYVFPRVVNWLIRKQLSGLKAEVVGERYVPLASKDMAAVITDIQVLKPDVILNTINGDSNIAFFHALKDAGIESEDIPVMSFSLGESELAMMHDDGDAVGHYAARNYFQSLDNPSNKRFIAAYQARFGKNKPVSDPMEAAWVGVHLWAKAVRSAQTDDPEIIREMIKLQSFRAAEGIVSVDHYTQHLWKTSRIGRIRADYQFDIFWTSDRAIRPSPYPTIVSKAEARMFLNQLYKGWNNHWQAPLLVENGEINE